MNENRDTEPGIGKVEKATRLGCGALLGFFVGLYLIAKLTIMSFGTAAALSVAAVLVCAFLALKFGDEFWYTLFGESDQSGVLRRQGSADAYHAVHGHQRILGTR